MIKYQRNNELISADLDEDLVMLDIEQGKYFSLNPVGRRIWDLLENWMSKEEIIPILLEEYEVSEAECKADVSQHLKELVKLKLISIK